MSQQEYILQLGMLEQQAREIQQHVTLVNQKITELDVLHLSLEKISSTSEKDFLAPLGDGVFIKAKLEEKELFVNVGSKIMVKKGIKETQEIIDKQRKQLEELRHELEGSIEKLNHELEHIVERARQEQGKEEEKSLEEAFGEAKEEKEGAREKRKKK